jgi:nitrogen regulatory protein PII
MVELKAKSRVESWVKSRAREKKEADSSISIKAVFIIADWDRVKVISDVIARESAICTVSKARGTATSDLLDILGLGGGDKAVFLCFVEASLMQGLIRSVRHALGARSAGAGIAFSVLLSGTTGNILTMFENIKADADAKNAAAGIATAPTAKTTKKETFMASLLSPGRSKGSKDSAGSIEIKNDVIISILNAGYSDEFMAEARKAGARGGTVFNARGLSAELAKKFLGISVQAEKEIVLILAQNDVKVPIMQAISAGFGTATKAAGLIFSLPVDQVMSLNDIA